MATILYPNGTTAPLTDLSLESIQRTVDGFIEGVLATEHRLMYVNEYGKVDNLPLNTQATRAYLYGDDDPICGIAVLLTREETLAEMAKE